MSDTQNEQVFVGDEQKALDEEHLPRHAETEGIEDHSDVPPRPAQPNRGPHKSPTQIAREVYEGLWGSQEDWAQHVEAAGFDVDQIQHLVNKGVGKRS